MIRNENRYCLGIQKEAPYTLKQEKAFIQSGFGGKKMGTGKSYTLAKRSIQRE